jgi:hypothetical protein
VDETTRKEESAMAKYACWQGDWNQEYGIDEESISAACAFDAAETYAISHEDGEDGAYVYVLNPDGNVHEFDFSYQRSVSISLRKESTRPAQEIANEAEED